MVFKKDGSKLYVANALSKTISVFSVAEAAGVSIFTPFVTIPDPGTNIMFSPRAVALSPDERYLIVASHDDGGTNHNIVKINLSDNSVAAVPGTAADGECIVFSPDGSRIYVAAYVGINVYNASDFAQIGTTWNMAGGRCGGIAVTPDGNHIYGAGWKSNYVSIFRNDGTKIEELTDFVSPYGVIIAP